jgi:hypothetical protein
MQDPRRRRAVLAGVAALALAAGIVIPVALTGGGDNSKPHTVVETNSPSTPVPTATVPTDTAKAPPPEVLAQPGQRQAARTVSSLVEAAESGDGNQFCSLVGLGPGQSEGLEALRSCARRSHIDPFSLPSSDELSVASVRLVGSRALVRLDGGGSFVLVRRGNGFVVRSWAPATS